MIGWGRLGAAGLALLATMVAANAATLGMTLRPETSTRITLPDRFVPIEIDTGEEVSLHYEGVSPIDIGSRDERPHLQTRMFEVEAVLDCRIEGEASDSLVVANAGSDPVPAGTTIKWQVKGSGQKGFFGLGKMLAAGQSVRATGIVARDTNAGDGCAARAV